MMLPMATTEVVLLAMVTECAALAVPRFRTVPKVIDVGSTVSGATAVPVTLTNCGLPVPV